LIFRFNLTRTAWPTESKFPQKEKDA
jgi:hypothetical protein